MNKKTQDIAYFISFCIEQYKNAKGISGTQAMQTLDAYGVLQYLENNFEVLHTESPQWLLEEIDEFINVRRKEDGKC